MELDAPMGGPQTYTLTSLLLPDEEARASMHLKTPRYTLIVKPSDSMSPMEKLFVQDTSRRSRRRQRGQHHLSANLPTTDLFADAPFFGETRSMSPKLTDAAFSRLKRQSNKQSRTLLHNSLMGVPSKPDLPRKVPAPYRSSAAPISHAQRVTPPSQPIIRSQSPLLPPRPPKAKLAIVPVGRPLRQLSRSMEEAPTVASSIPPRLKTPSHLATIAAPEAPMIIPGAARPLARPSYPSLPPRPRSDSGSPARLPLVSLQARSSPILQSSNPPPPIVSQPHALIPQAPAIISQPPLQLNFAAGHQFHYQANPLVEHWDQEAFKQLESRLSVDEALRRGRSRPSPPGSRSLMLKREELSARELPSLDAPLRSVSVNDALRVSPPATTTLLARTAPLCVLARENRGADRLTSSDATARFGRQLGPLYPPASPSLARRGRKKKNYYEHGKLHGLTFSVNKCTLEPGAQSGDQQDPEFRDPSLFLPARRSFVAGRSMHDAEEVSSRRARCRC